MNETSDAQFAQSEDAGTITVGSSGCCGSVLTPGGPAWPTDSVDGGGPAGLVDAGIVTSVDASVADVEVHGVVPLPEDAGYDAHHPIGVVVEPPDSGSRITCPPICGVVIGLGPNPGH